ncbi:ribose 5-phosphate isomerase B [Candidatus Omnitrophota bacterium]
MKPIVTIGADHRGFALKKKAVTFLKSKGYKVKDVGTHSTQSCDHPEISIKVAKQASTSKNNRGIMICKTGIGSAIAANKVLGVRAALCYNQKAARLSRQHNDSNVLVLGSDFVKSRTVGKLLTIWLTTAFEGGRHIKRVNQIKDFEKKTKKKA